MLRFQFLVKMGVMLEITEVGGSRVGRGVSEIKMGDHSLAPFYLPAVHVKKGWASISWLCLPFCCFDSLVDALIEGHLLPTQRVREHCFLCF